MKAVKAAAGCAELATSITDDEVAMAIHVPEPLAWPLAVHIRAAFCQSGRSSAASSSRRTQHLCDLRLSVRRDGRQHWVGYETAVGLAKRGATVKIACRDATSRDAAAHAAAAVGGAGTVEFVALDLGDLDSVRACAASLAKCDILVCNGGINSLAPAKPTRE